MLLATEALEPGKWADAILKLWQAMGWQLSLLIALLIFAWAWKTAKVPLIRIGRDCTKLHVEKD